MDKTQKDISEIKITLKKMNDEMAKITRKQKELDEQMTLIYDDHNLLETIQGNITALHERINLSLNHHEKVVKDVKKEVIERGLEVKEKVQDVKEKMEEKVDAVAQNIAKAIDENNDTDNGTLKKLLKGVRRK